MPPPIDIVAPKQCRGFRESGSPWAEAHSFMLAPPTRLISNAELSMGLRPRLSAVAASRLTGTPGWRRSAAYWNPGLAPGGLSLKNPVPRQCCGLGESGEAAVGAGHPSNRRLQGFLIKQRSRASMPPRGWRPGINDSKILPPDAAQQDYPTLFFSLWEG